MRLPPLLAAIALAGCVVYVPPRPQPLPDRVREGLVRDAEERAARECPQDLGTALNPDGSLVLTGSAVVILGPGPHTFSRICVQDSAVIRICGPTVLRITGETPSVIGGGGIGPLGLKHGSLRIEAPNRPPLYVLVENKTSSVDLFIDSPGGTVRLAVTGKTGLHVDSTPLQTLATNAGWGDTNNFPRCH